MQRCLVRVSLSIVATGWSENCDNMFSHYDTFHKYYMDVWNYSSMHRACIQCRAIKTSSLAVT